MSSQPARIVLGVTGSIAAVKAPQLVRLLVDSGYVVECALSESAERFVAPLALETFSRTPVFSQMFDSGAYQMPHLRMANSASLLLIAPATAATIARCAHGLAEDPVSLIYVSTTAPTLFAPAMHDTMWQHPATQDNVRILKSRGVQFIGPKSGPLADNTRAEGRMEEPEQIVAAVKKALSKK